MQFNVIPMVWNISHFMPELTLEIAMYRATRCCSMFLSLLFCSKYWQIFLKDIWAPCTVFSYPQPSAVVSALSSSSIARIVMLYKVVQPLTAVRKFCHAHLWLMSSPSLITSSFSALKCRIHFDNASLSSSCFVPFSFYVNTC